MSALSNPLRMLVFLKDQQHFIDMNDFIAYNRSKVKNYSWYHGFIQDPVDSHLDIEFFNITDALMFKLQYG